MGNYVENSLGKNETIVKKADRNGLFLLSAWLKGILFCWLLFIPTIKAIIATIQFNHVELAITTKRVVGKTGVFNTKSLDAPLNKVQNVSVTQKLSGKIFNFSTVKITTAAGELAFGAIKNGEAFKSMLMSQIDQFEEDRIKLQATQMAQAVAGAINK
ncbi:MAG: PH domain-containing protein [Clostridia bacterium]|nr:PH domain-containing protein [Clostridia bacterium]